MHGETVKFNFYQIFQGLLFGGAQFLADFSQSCIHLQEPGFCQISHRLVFTWRSPVSTTFFTDLYSSGGAHFLPDFSQTRIYLE